MDYIANSEGSIWVVWKSPFKCFVLHICKQYIFIQVEIASIEMKVSFVHASCDNNMRLSLWNDFINLNIFMPWIIVGDFINVTNPSEKLGCRLMMLNDVSYFNNIFSKTGLVDGGLFR